MWITNYTERERENYFISTYIFFSAIKCNMTPHKIIGIFQQLRMNLYKVLGLENAKVTEHVTHKLAIEI